MYEKKIGWQILIFHDENPFSKFEIGIFWKIFRTKNRKFEIFIFLVDFSKKHFSKKHFSRKHRSKNIFRPIFFSKKISSKSQFKKWKFWFFDFWSGIFSIFFRSQILKMDFRHEKLIFFFQIFSLERFRSLLSIPHVYTASSCPWNVNSKKTVQLPWIWSYRDLFASECTVGSSRSPGRWVPGIEKYSSKNWNF